LKETPLRDRLRQPLDQILQFPVLLLNLRLAVLTDPTTPTGCRIKPSDFLNLDEMLTMHAVFSLGNAHFRLLHIVSSQPLNVTPSTNPNPNICHASMLIPL
jgi:histidinol-phosphate/aromatic aminotransferase/cobyric acid decarboxylase-like protein